MLLFADEVAGTGNAWIYAISTGGAIFAALFAWLSSRDRLRHDSRLTKLEDGLTKCEQEHADSKKDRDRLQKEAEDAKEKAETARLANARFEVELSLLRSAVVESRKEVETVRAILYGEREKGAS